MKTLLQMKVKSDYKTLVAHLWRRGRGVIAWRFTYIYYSNASWFTTAGWYRTARKFTYRLTIDHDFPHHPIWLGVRSRGRWVNTEKLYDPLMLVHRNFTLMGRNLDGARFHRRGPKRVFGSTNYQRRLAGDMIELAEIGVRAVV